MSICDSVLQMLVNYGKSGGDEVVVPITVFGQENMSVQLSCSLSLNVTPTRVQWFDLVYNTNPDPILIFDSRNNTNRQVSDLHPNRHNFEVSSSVAYNYWRKKVVFL